MIENRPAFVIVGLVVLSFFLFSDAAMATTASPGGGGGYQWETAIQNLTRSITGPVAFGFLILGLVVLGVKLTIGGEFGDIARGVMNFVIAGSFIAFAAPLIQGQMFSGAVVPDNILLLL